MSTHPRCDKNSRKEHGGIRAKRWQVPTCSPRPPKNELKVLELGGGGVGGWCSSPDSQHVHIWQSLAQSWPTQLHCAPVIAAFPEQMKLSVGGRLRPDSCSSLSLQSLANKYVGFQSCHRRHWTLGQGAKRRAKAFPSPCNLSSMSLVTSPGHPFSMSRPQGPQGPRSHTLPVGRALHASLCIWQSSLSFFSSEHLCVWHAEEPEITRRVNRSKKLFWQNVIRRNVGGPTSARWLTLRRNAFLHAVSPSLISEGGGRRKADCCHVSRAATAAPDTQMIIFIGDLVYYWVDPACVSLCHQDWQRSKSEGRLCVDVSFFLFSPLFLYLWKQDYDNCSKAQSSATSPTVSNTDLCKRKKNHVSFFKHSNKKNNSCSGYKHVPRPQNLMTVHLPSCVLTQQITVSSYTTQLQHYLLSGDFNVVSL